jgi:hypothetical protein
LVRFLVDILPVEAFLVPLEIVLGCKALYSFAAGYITLVRFAVFEHMLSVTINQHMASYNDAAYALVFRIALEYI